MNRLAGIIVVALGLIIVVLSIAKLVPDLTQPGIVFVLLGGLLFGLSLVRKPDPQGLERMPTPATLLNIFVSPAETFQNLRRHPRWFVAALIIAVLSAAFMNLFLYRLTPERVTNYAIDKTLELPLMNDQARRRIEAGRQNAVEQNKNPVLKGGQAVTGFAGNVFKYALYATIFLGFIYAMGGQLNFWQAFSVAVYSAFPVAVINYVLGSVILLLKDPIDIHPILGQGSLVQDNLGFLFSPSESPAFYGLASHVSVLWFYWVWLVATGLRNSGEKVSGTAAWTTALVLFGLLLVIGVVGSYLFSGFIG